MSDPRETLGKLREEHEPCDGMCSLPTRQLIALLDVAEAALSLPCECYAYTDEMIAAWAAAGSTPPLEHTTECGRVRAAIARLGEAS